MLNCKNYCNFANILIFTVLKIHHLSVEIYMCLLSLNERPVC